MTKKHMFTTLSLLLSVLLFIAGCSSSNATSPAPALTSSPSGEQIAGNDSEGSSKTIRFGYSPWIGSVGAIIAQAKNIFAEKGVNVEFVKMEGSTKDAFMSGKLDVVVQSLDGVVQMKSKEKADDPIQIIAVVDKSKGADGIIANESVTSLAELKGKSVAVSIGSLAHFLLLHALETVGLQESDVNIVNMDNNLAGSTFMSGQVDAAVTWEPYLSQAVEKNGHLLYSTADAPDLIVDTLVTRKSMIDQYPEELKKMAEAFDGGLALFNNGDEGKQLVGDELGMDLEAVKSTAATLDLTTLEDSKKMLLEDKAAWEQQMAAFVQFFISQKILTESLDTSGIINPFLFN
ncbi:NitT/TauT family transport system substrate-binding protein [Paenibacillus algorifonticola]|uniref:NitT/TauT family transport system substrate-binding protein n=1 Tax=Paenibacillus algorifonticola TaxID=684063 RepID=A0A1I1Z278_9BACL|nr:ABC transporter substrate-binding protein [Paenibacillus algorifonticola]SFE25954.1 NitT/TauT family transport system substrate-binding protein [Paenibacillus algorifonticola]